MRTTSTEPATTPPGTSDDNLVHIVCLRQPIRALCGTTCPTPDGDDHDGPDLCVVCDDLELNAPDYCPLGGRCDCL